MSGRSGSSLLRWFLAAVVVLLVAGLGLLEPLDRLLVDARAGLASRPATGRVVVVGIDAESQALLERWPWPRRHHAALIDRLVGAGATRIGLDLDLSARAEPADDRLLAAAPARAGPERVALAGFRQHQPVADGPMRVVETVPASELAERAALATVNVVPDADGLVRRYPAGDRLAGAWRPSLAHWLAGRATGPDEPALALDPAIDVATLPYLSVADVLAADFDPAWVGGRLVLVGAVDPSLGDSVAVPRWRALPGVVIHALAAETVLQDRAPRALDGIALASLVAVGMLLLGPRLERCSPAAVAGGGGALVAAAGGLALLLEARWSLRLPLAPLLAGWLATLPVVTAAASGRLRAARAAAALEAERRRRLVEGIVASSFDGILTLAADGRVLTANPAAGTILGIAAESAVGRRLADLAPTLAQATGGGPERCREVTLELPGGRLRTLETTATRLVDTVAGEVGILVLRDVSEARATAAALDRLLHRDEETGLANRRRLEELLDDLLRRSAPAPRALACLAVEVASEDGPPGRHDPETDPGLLAELATALAERLRPATPVARVRADALAFAVPVEVADAGAAEALATAALAAGGPAAGPLRVGLALAPADAADGPGLLRCALLAAARVHAAGGGWARYAAQADHRRLRRLRLLAALRTALREERLHLVFQPKVDTWTGTPVGLEALVRWRDPELGEVAPSEFVPLAEEAGLVGPLTRLVVRRAVADQARLAAAGIDLPVAVNLSARSLDGPRAGADLLRLLAEAGGTPGRLHLEVTETALAHSGAEAIACLGALRAAGFAIALDDFGVGYSSFARLRDLPLSAVKLDRALVRLRPGDRGGDLVLAAVLELAEKLGLETIGEGVEEEADLERLRAFGCTHAQGWLIARPMPLPELIAWARSRPAARPAGAGPAAPPGRDRAAVAAGRAGPAPAGASTTA